MLLTWMLNFTLLKDNFLIHFSKGEDGLWCCGKKKRRRFNLNVVFQGRLNKSSHSWGNDLAQVLYFSRYVWKDTSFRRFIYLFICTSFTTHRKHGYVSISQFTPTFFSWMHESRMLRKSESNYSQTNPQALSSQVAGLGLRRNRPKVCAIEPEGSKA